MSTRRSSARRFLEDAAGDLTLASFLVAIREGEGWTQAEMARLLGVSRSHPCDLEKGRKTLSPGRAAAFATVLGYSEKQFVRLALQELIDDAGLDFQVRVA